MVEEPVMKDRIVDLINLPIPVQLGGSLAQRDRDPPDYYSRQLWDGVGLKGGTGCLCSSPWHFPVVGRDIFSDAFSDNI